MRLISRHDHHLSPGDANRFARDRDFDFPLKHVHKSIERCRVLTQFLAAVEGEERNVSRLLLQDYSADHRAILIFDKINNLQHLRR